MFDPTQIYPGVINNARTIFFFEQKVLIHNACDRGILMHGSANSFGWVEALTASRQPSLGYVFSGGKEPLKIGGDIFWGPPFIHGHRVIHHHPSIWIFQEKIFRAELTNCDHLLSELHLASKKSKGSPFHLPKVNNFINFQPCLASSWSKRHQFGSSPMHMATHLQRDHLQQWDG